MFVLTSKVFDYVGTDGACHSVYPCNIVKRHQMLSRIHELHNLIAKVEDKTQSFAYLYSRSLEMRHICKNILELGGVDPSTVSLDNLYDLIMMTPDGEIGHLLALNFNKEELISDEAVSDVKIELATMLGNLWAATESYSEASKAMQELPAADLLEALRARSKAIQDSMLTPEDRAKRDGKAKAMDMLKSKAIKV